MLSIAQETRGCLPWIFVDPSEQCRAFLGAIIIMGTVTVCVCGVEEVWAVSSGNLPKFQFSLGREGANTV